MLRRLRIRMTATIVAVSSTVCLVAFCAILATTCANLYEPLHGALTNAAQRGPGEDFEPVIGRHEPPMGGGPEHRDGFIPVAVADVLADGGVVESNATFDLMEEPVRTAAVTEALALEKPEGLIANRALAYYRIDRDDGTFTVALADAGDYAWTVRKTALGVSAVFLCVVAFVALFAWKVAKAITRPVQEAWDKQAEFVADASHELKTPLTVILANANILQGDQALALDAQKWVRGIGDEATHMKGLVEELLFLARSDETSGDVGRPKEDVDLSGLVLQACLSFDAVAFEAGVELHDLVDRDVHVSGDRAQLERLVRSLVDNAIKYAGDGGTVTVALCARKKGHPAFSVTNTGTAIAPEDLERVFDRFWRSDQARSRSQNTSYGLGLAIAKSIAESHGARIEATSSPESGTTFTVSF